MNQYKKQYNPELVKFVEHVASLPSGPERWGAAIALWLKKNEIIQTPEGPMTARQYNDLQIAHNAALRDEQLTKFGEIKGGGMRLSLAIPEGAWQMVKLVDPPAFQTQYGDSAGVARNLRRFMQAFPQYVIGVD